MANYELMFIIDPSLSEDEKTSTIDNVKAILKKFSTKIEKEDIWGEKKLAYKINRSNIGFYALFELNIDGTQIKNISKEFNLEQKLWRYMFTKIED